MSKPLLLFAPGAGAPSSQPWMQEWAARLWAIGRVELFDYTYQSEGRKRPDPLPQLIATHRRALRAARKPGEAVVLIGKSMGGRIGCHVSLQESVHGLVCLGYPLCAGGDRTRRRDTILRELDTPVLFVQGTRDPLCPLELLEPVRKQMRAHSVLYTVQNGNHSLFVPKRQLRMSGKTQRDVDDGIAEAISRFIDEIGDSAKHNGYSGARRSTP